MLRNIKFFLWNYILCPVLDFSCRAEKCILTNPSGNIHMTLCEGWCQSYEIKVRDYRNVGFGSSRFRRDVLPAYVSKLKEEGWFIEADELSRVLNELV